MKRVFVLAALAALMVSTRAGAEASDEWFNTGDKWYEHPCGLQAFAKYGRTTEPTPQVRDAYFQTLKNPELCSRLLP
jgi:hypothetical protein